MIDNPHDPRAVPTEPAPEPHFFRFPRMWSRFQKPAILVSMLIVLVVPLLVTGPLAAGLIAVALGVMLFSLIEAVLRRRSRQRE